MGEAAPSAADVPVGMPTTIEQRRIDTNTCFDTYECMGKTQRSENMDPQTNRLRELRKKAGLTQRKLATAASTSQQQIQRIEAGQSTTIELALRICGVLEKPLDVVFPGTRKAVARLKKAGTNATSELLSDRTLEELGRAGIDADSRQWFLKVVFESGVQRVYRISSMDVDRFYRNLNDESQIGVPFFLFETDAASVAINLSRLAHAHVLFEVAFTVVDEAEAETGAGIRVFMASTPQPLTFDAEPDEDVEEGEDDEGNVRNFLWYLELGLEADRFVSFVDVDGERASFRVGSIDLVEVDTDIVAPTDFEDDDDDDCDPAMTQPKE